MAIKINLQQTEKDLFCSSKWWGDPEMNPDASYPVVKCEIDGEESEYPLTFICQINLEDIAPYDKEGRLPHEGMLYFFAALDEYAGYDSPVHNGIGPWDKGQFKVKYSKHVNFETFESCILIDDDDQPLTEPALEMTFEACEDSSDCTKLLGEPFFEEVRSENPGLVNLLQIDSDTAGLQFFDEGQLNFLIDPKALSEGKFSTVKVYLCSL